MLRAPNKRGQALLIYTSFGRGKPFGLFVSHLHNKKGFPSHLFEFNWVLLLAKPPKKQEVKNYFDLVNCS